MILKHKIKAYLTLLSHYRKIFSFYWGKRHQLGGNLFKENEANFLPAALSLQEQPVSPSLRLTAWILAILIVFLILWSVIGKIDIIVNATGDIIHSERTKAIASIEVASVKALYVEEGQSVKKGDLLIELDASASDAEHEKAVSGLTEARLQIERSKALIESIDNNKAPKLKKMEGISDIKINETQGQLDSIYNDYSSKLGRIDALIEKYSSELPIATQKANDFRELAKNHDVSNHAYLEKQQALLELEGQLNDAIKQRRSLVAETRRTAYESKTEGDKILGAAEQDAARTKARSRLMKLISPVDGTVQQLSVFTVGGVVQAAQPLMKIVPQGDFVVVEALVENKDIGFIEEGQPVAVKIDAFDYTKYGTISAKVSHISRDAFKDEKRGLLYSVLINLDKSTISVHEHEMQLNPGMTVKVDIKTGTRRVIEYFLSPLIKQVRESINER